MKPNPLVSVIVPFYNAENTILNCLKSLIIQDYPKLEIIFVDNNSTDKSTEKIKHFPIKVLKEDQKGSYVARNTGLKKSRGEIIAFIDADCVAESTWISSLVECYQDKEIGAIGGRIKSFKPRTEFEIYAMKAGHVSQHGIKFLPFANKMNNMNFGYFQTANLSFRRSAIEKVGGFNEKYVSGGDVDICLRLKASGYKLIYCQNALIYHKHRTTLKGLIKQWYKYGKGSSHLHKQYYRGSFRINSLIYLFKSTLIFSCYVIRRLFGKDISNGLSKTKFFWLQIITGIAFISGKIKGNVECGSFLL